VHIDQGEYIMPGISRVNGNAAAGSFYGYQPLFFKVTNTADDIGTASTGGGTSAIVEGNFEKAIRAIQRSASVVIVGARGDAGFVVGIDGATANAFVSANTDTDVAAALDAVISAATGKSDVTVAAITLAVDASGVIS
jgi:hypothetical protein